MPRTKEQNMELRENTRNRILHASMKLFGENGFDRTSVNAIAKEAKISKGLIYNHFETKEDIVKGITNMLIKMGEDIIIPTEKFSSPKHHLKHIIDQFFVTMGQESELMKWMIPMSFQIERFPFVTEIMTQKIEGIITETTHIFSELNYSDPQQESWYFGALFDGITMGQLLVPGYNIKKMQQYILSKYQLENL